MKHILHNYLILISFFFSANSFSEIKNPENTTCPTASITYSSNSFCVTVANPQAVTLTGTDAYLGGVFSSSPGLVINTITGEIAPSTSALGTYLVSYTIPDIGGCGSITASTTVTISPSNTVSAASSTQTVCINTSITTITHTTTGATGIGAAIGLPAGIAAIWSANTITISGTPMMAGTFNYSIPITGGCGTTVATGTIIVLPNNTVSMASYSPILCPNTPISPAITHNTIGATGIISTGLPQGVTATWSGNTITITGTPTSAIGSPFNYSITLTGGCGTAFATGTITVLSVPENTTITGSTTICAGTPVNLTITGTPGAVVSMSNGGAPVSYTIGASGSHVISVSPTVTTTYTLTSANLNGCGVPIFGQSATVTVSSTPQFITQIPDIYICNGGMLNIASQLTSTVPGATFIWSATTGNINTVIMSGDETNIDQIVDLINTSQNGTINIEVKPQIGSCFGASQQILVTVTPIPTITSTIANDTSICNNETVTISTNSNSATSYNWQVATASGVQIVGGATSGTSTTNTINLQLALINSSVAGSISFNLTPVNGNCIGATVFNAVTITVNPKPGAPISLSNYGICSGEMVNLFLSTNPNIAGTTLEWTVVDSQNVSGFSNGSGLSPIFIDDILYSYTNTQGFVTYSVTSKLGDCEGGTTNYTVYVNPLPHPVLTNGNICVDATTGLAYQGYLLDTQLSNPNFTYEWYLLNTTTNTYDQIAGASASTYEANVAGNYQVIVTNTSSNCIDFTSADVIETFPATGISTTISDNSTITVDVNPIGTGNLIYALDNGVWQESNTFTEVETGTHTVLVSDLEGCTNLSAVVIVNETLVDLVMYPNPTFDSLSFKNKNKVISIQITNQLGQTVLLKDINQKNGTINLSGLNMGLYNVVFETESETINQKIIKQ